MQLVLTEDQSLLASSAREFVAQNASVQRLRKLRDSRDERGYSLEAYRQIASLGWTAIPFTEEDGGLAMGLASLVIVTEALGRALSPEPLVSSVVLGGRSIALGGSAALKAEWLAPAIAGEKILALASSRPRGRFELANPGIRAVRDGAGFKLTGTAAHVLGGHLADAYVVAARTSGEEFSARGVTLFVVPASATGVRSEREWRVDALNAATLTLESVSVREADVLGRIDEGLPLLQRVTDEATVALSGEMLGGALEAFDRTLGYLRERKQFGVAIGTFQALQHRAARLFIELELTRSAVMAAARAVDANASDAEVLVSVAKAKASDTFALVTNEAVQMHGGIGMTDEHEIGFYLKRAKAAEMTFGDAAYHRERCARLAGY